jgi:hypothetical protein
MCRARLTIPFEFPRIASAFDLYLVGRLLDNVPDSEFITTQASIMGDAAEQAGLAPAQFDALLAEVTVDPEHAFEDLRSLLFDVARAAEALPSVPSDIPL